jgi:hypothetical protein
VIYDALGKTQSMFAIPDPKFQSLLNPRRRASKMTVKEESSSDSDGDKEARKIRVLQMEK